MKTELFEENDPEGEKTLKIISEADFFNKWMYEIIAPLCKGEILEIGSGIGNISSFFLTDGHSMTLSDIRPNYFNYLHQKFKSYGNLNDILILNLVDELFEEKFKNYKGRFDSVFALNVVEHIEDDSRALKNCRFMLKPGGSLVILVPAYQSIYSELDKNLGHYRRYTLTKVQELFIQNGFEIIHKQYFNFIGVLGWFFTGKILKKQTIPLIQMRIFNLFVPLFKLIDKVLFKKAGLSVIISGKIISNK
jgi:SAM-dependent methyltransferase